MSNMTMLTKEELLSKDRLDAVKSQKASAIFNYIKAYESWSIPQDWSAPTALPILLDDTRLHVLSSAEVICPVEAGRYPMFLRTCPLTPRHGVLESVRCDSEGELLSEFARLRDIMLEHDPEGCLMLMPFIQADNSAVVAMSSEKNDFTGYAVIGEGHDGVTAGHGFSLGFPLREEKHSDNIAISALGIDPYKHELEFVFQKNGIENERNMFDSVNSIVSLTQIRGAPEHTPINPPPRGVNTIGMIADGEVIIKDFMVMSGLEEVLWLEENITPEKLPEGFMVIEPNGSRLSHIYAHCRGVGVPYAITDSVNVGDRWVEPTAGWVVLDNDGVFQPEPYDPYEYKADFIRGINTANEYWAKQQGWFSTFFHQWVSLPYSDPQHTAFLAGVFCGWMPKAMMALGLGEMRHATNLKTNAQGAMFAAITACIGKDVWVKVNDKPHLGSNRQSYYAAVGHIKPTYRQMSKMLFFLSKHYAKGWVKSYGGSAWGDSMETGARYAMSIDKFLSEPTDENLGVLIRDANLCENAVHNNGSLFNKWLSKRAFDAGTSGFNIRNDLPQMASVHIMAQQLMNTDELKPADEPVNDWDEILDFVFKKTPAYWRKNPFAISEKVPESMREAAKVMPVGFRHGEKGSHNYPLNKDFIMCGVETCSKCAKFKVWAESHKTEIPELVEIEKLFEGVAVNLMLTPAKLDAWLVGSVVETTATVKQQIALIKAKEFSPDPEQFKQLYMALSTSDTEYAEMVQVLNKYLSKKEDKEEYISALIGKGNDKKEEIE